MGFLFQDTSGAQAGVASGQSALEQARGQQMSLAQMLKQQYSGTGPNAALGMMQRGSEEAIKRSAGALASQRGINPALAQRLASQQAAQQTQEAAQQGAILQAQQQQAALGGLQNVYGQIGQQALGQYGAAQQAYTGQMGANQEVMGRLVGGLASGLGAVGAAAMAPGAVGAAAMAKGGKVPGKPEVDGDSYANDKVPAMLSPGEIVVPRSKAKDPDKAKEFIDHIMEGKEEDSKEVTYADVLAMQKQLSEMIKKLERK